MYKKILVAVDGSEQAAKAALHGAELAAKLGADLILFHVVPALPSYASISPDQLGIVHQDVAKEFYKQGREILNQAMSELADYNINISKEISVGHPADEICKMVANCGCDLLIMGSRGLGQFKGYLMGSVSNRVCRLAGCPVLIMR
ncbi:Stress response protein NhaX [Pelotomaculum schinkii]|uniref:Stress response protein NhaX n=1 Tax=Pelotomaculum schinkii TaxID=78350 RepID=A0A4Y7RHF6_9FIRM|nr:universal stress protein [Pelotomaculum schinkii]TEB08122.1 Stress response protein NhaX [Pelotomaculum schinkii]